MPLGPPAMFAVTRGSKSSLVRAITQPEVPTPVQSTVNPKKKKSVPPLTNGLKNSVQPVQRAEVEVVSCSENVGVVSMTNVPRGTLKLKPKEYCHGVTSAAPVPHSRATPVEGSVK